MIKVNTIIDERGRVLLCKLIREEFGATLNTPIEITADSDSIVIKKTKKVLVCSLCESNKNLKRIKSGFVCEKCIERIKKCD